MALASTICFRAKWRNEFLEENTKEGVFHSPGGDTDCRYMYQNSQDIYYWGERFSAVGKYLEDSGTMWLILPDEGVDAEKLLTDEETMDFIFSGGMWEKSKNTTIHLTMPKFDVSSDTSLIDGLSALGITDIFDVEKADFSPLIKNESGVIVSEAKHAVRVTADEKGCTAAAYTVMMAAGSAMPQGEAEFVLDRPFLFVITNLSGLPLFAGIVNQPAG